MEQAVFEKYLMMATEDNDLVSRCRELAQSEIGSTKPETANVTRADIAYYLLETDVRVEHGLGEKEALPAKINDLLMMYRAQLGFLYGSRVKEKTP